MIYLITSHTRNISDFKKREDMMMKPTEGIFTFFFLEGSWQISIFFLSSMVRDFVFSECTSVCVFLVCFSIPIVTSETELDRLLHLKLPSSN